MSPKQIQIPRLLLSTDTDLLQILQSSELLPNQERYTSLKDQLKLQLNTEDIENALRNHNSPLFKYVQALILCQVARYEAAKEEATRQALNMINKKEREQDYELYEESLHQAAEQDRLTQQTLLIYESHKSLPPYILVSKDEATKVTSILVQEAKFQDLKFYAQFAKTSEELNKIQQSIEEHYEIVNDNFAILDTLKNTAATPEVMEKVQTLEDEYIERLKLVTPEKIQKIVKDIDLNDNKSRDQFLKQRKVAESFYTKNYIQELEEMGLNRDAVQLKSAYSPPPSLRATQLNVKTIFNQDYKKLQDTLNDKLEVFFKEKNGVFTTGFFEILKLQDMLYEAAYQKPNGKFSKNLGIIANKAYQILKRQNNPQQIDIVNYLLNLRDKDLAGNVRMDQDFDRSGHEGGKYRF